MKTMNNFGKRSLAMFLVLVMCLGMMNLTVFAAEEHTHNEDGWTCTQGASSQGDLRCTLHVHDENCYSTEQGELTCQQEEHTHSDACYEAGEEILTCVLVESDGHTHTDDCYKWETEKELTCSIEEGHSHGNSCYTETQVKGDLNCSDESEDHEHNDACFEGTTDKQLTCPIKEGHSHNDDCYTEQRTQGSLTCELAESEGHKHSDDCKSVEQILACDKDEHTHDDGCYAPGETVKTCTEPDHTHTSDCYESVEGEWTCTPPESTEEPEPAECTCTEKCGEDGSENCAVCAEDSSACKGEEVEEPQPPAVCICDVKCVEDSINSECPVCTENIAGCAGKVPVDVDFVAETGTLTIGNAETLTKEVVAGYLSAKGIKNTEVKELVLSNTGDIDRYAFQGFSAVTNITINNAGAIGDYAFYMWGNLESVTIDGAASIGITNDYVGSRTFFKCANLKTVDLKNIGTITSNAFAENKALTSVSLDTIDVVGPEVFRQCSALTELNIKDVGTLERSPFSYCTGLTELTLDGVEIGNTAFYGCTGLTSVELKNIDTIGQQAFTGCTSLKTVTMENIGTVGVQAFSYYGNNVLPACTALETVTMSNVGTIGKNAFASCTALENVEMGTVNTIEQYAFWYCSALKTIDSLSNVRQSIGGFAFYGCKNLTGLTVADAAKMGYIGSGADVMDRIEKILKGKFLLDSAANISELSQESGWDVGAVGKSQNWDTYDNGTQLMEQARWQNVSAGVAEVKVNAYYTAEKQMDYIFVADLSASMASLGNPGDSNARFYDMQSKLLDMTDKLLSTEGYDCRVAIVIFGGDHAGSATHDNSKFLANAGEAANYIKALEPLNENTDYGLGMQEALELVKSNPGRNTVVVFLSDGAPNRGTSGDMNGTSTAAQIKAAGVPIYGVLHSPTAGQHDKALAIMKAVCDGGVYESTDTESFGGAMNKAFSSAFGEHTVTIPVNNDDFNVSVSGEGVEYDASTGTITWSVGMPFTPHTLTYTMSLKSDRVNAIGTTSYALNKDIARFGDNGASVDLTMALMSRTVNAPVVLRDLTINYLFEDGTQAAESVTISVAEGAAYSVASPVVEGYVASPLSVEGIMGTGNVEFNVTYLPVEVAHTLTINYVFANGEQAAESVTVQVAEGAAYSVSSPVLEGYAADLLTVEGTMGTDDVAVTVTYTTTGGTTGGGTTGGGSTGGGDTGTDTDTGTDNPPAPPTEEVTDPNVPLVETPEEEIPNEEVPLVETPNIPTEETLIEEKELEELLGEEVPLVDVPQTGDNSALWYAMTLLSACGLAALNPLKKREK